MRGMKRVCSHGSSHWVYFCDAVNFAKVTYARAYSKYYFGYKKITEDQFARTHIIMAEYCEMVNYKGKRHLFKC